MLTNVRLRKIHNNVYEITGLTPQKSLELRCSRCLRWLSSLSRHAARSAAISPRLLTIDLDTDEVLCYECFEEEEGPCA